MKSRTLAAMALFASTLIGSQTADAFLNYCQGPGSLSGTTLRYPASTNNLSGFPYFTPSAPLNIPSAGGQLTTTISLSQGILYPLPTSVIYNGQFLPAGTQVPACPSLPSISPPCNPPAALNALGKPQPIVPVGAGCGCRADWEAIVAPPNPAYLAGSTANPRFITFFFDQPAIVNSTLANFYNYSNPIYVPDYSLILDMAQPGSYAPTLRSLGESFMAPMGITPGSPSAAIPVQYNVPYISYSGAPVTLSTLFSTMLFTNANGECWNPSPSVHITLIP